VQDSNVWQAQKKEEEVVAIKQLKKHPDGIRRRLIKNEISSLITLSDLEGVVQLLQVFEGPKLVSMVMEWIGDEDLFSYTLRIHRQAHLQNRFPGGLPVSEIHSLFVQMIDIVRSCHIKNIAHRDIKLENFVLYSNYTKIKLVDFGHSSKMVPSKLFIQQCGSLAYNSPERVLLLPYEGKQADIWSLGICLFAMSCGRFPFYGTTDETQSKMILEAPLKFYHSMNPSMIDLIKHMLKRDPKQRAAWEFINSHPWVTKNVT